MRRASEEAILPHYRKLSGDQVREKAADDVVTIADHASEELLAEGLAKLNPGIAIVGEEAAEANPAVMDRLAGACWIIDPLDGTNNFAAGKPPFGILIALAEHGEAKSGWIYDCLSGRFCAAHLGDGAFVDGERVTARATGEEPPVAAISLLFMARMQRERVKTHIAPHYRLVDIPRCAAEQYPRLALGENDVSIFERTLPWDHAAGALWLNEAGGRVARPSGLPYRVDEWREPGLVGAASPRLWDDLVARLAALADEAD
ncbi:inositol monophosphatase family protein [Qipengyuania sp. MTN3-11]|uniref:inositol monophosphatase family protein n=1 Tax=Qipengyuania sp. MTN3-11 TaxID=3056557 RepID=UPI0036F2290B